MEEGTPAEVLDAPRHERTTSVPDPGDAMIGRSMLSETEKF